ncbi:aldolase [Cubamyces lactineus]|nr:aldolase [Cubamyces lactineus]
MPPATTLLADVRAKVTIDVDSMDPDVAARHTTPEHKFCDMTSNQAIVYSEAVRPQRAHVFNAAVDQIRSAESQLDLESQVSNAIDLLTVLLAKEVYPHITGRVHAQTSPSAAYDTEATIQHAKKLVALFEANGIPKSRVCIKIPATPESIVACNYLERLGIRTLATCLFSVPQAMAAHQAGCLYVAPYFNGMRLLAMPCGSNEKPLTGYPLSPAHLFAFMHERYRARHPTRTLRAIQPGFLHPRCAPLTATPHRLRRGTPPRRRAELRVHSEPGVWKEYADTAREHPMAPVVGAVVRVFKEVGSSTLVMPASIVTAKEVLALVSLKPDHLTLSGAVLDQLAASESAAGEAPKPHHPDVPLGATPSESALTGAHKEPDVKSINYLENGAAALREAFGRDAEVSRKMADALKIFGEMEEKTKELLRAALRA